MERRETLLSRIRRRIEKNTFLWEITSSHSLIIFFDKLIMAECAVKNSLFVKRAQKEPFDCGRLFGGG